MALIWDIWRNGFLNLGFIPKIGNFWNSGDFNPGNRDFLDREFFSYFGFWESLLNLLACEILWPEDFDLVSLSFRFLISFSVFYFLALFESQFYDILCMIIYSDHLRYFNFRHFSGDSSNVKLRFATTSHVLMTYEKLFAAIYFSLASLLSRKPPIKIFENPYFVKKIYQRLSSD